MKKELFGCLLVAILIVPNKGWAQKNPALEKAAKSKVPVVITARQAEFNNKEHKATYKVDVKVVRGEMIMYANLIEAFFDQEGKEIDRIVATGDVKVEQEGKIITAQKATYYEKEQKIIFEGNPVSRDGKNVVEGSRMEYFINQERIIVDDAKTVLHPDQNKMNKKQK